MKGMRGGITAFTAQEVPLQGDFLSNQRLQTLGQVTTEYEGRSYSRARGTVEMDNEYNQ